VTLPLDPAGDPDRYDPDRYDPDRSSPDAPAGRTLPELLGDGAYEDERNPWTWLTGLAGVVAFLLLVAFVVSHLGPR
jgi:hypothetical protein